MTFLLAEFPDLSKGVVWISFITLTFLEIVLGIDNIIFISIQAAKLKKEDRKKAVDIGLVLAMIMRIALLFGVSWLIAMESPWLQFHYTYLEGAFSGQSIILILGGLFLLYKSTTEIHHKLEESETLEGVNAKTSSSLNAAILQIVLINIVFSFDSILTAVGMTSGLNGALWIMIAAVVLSVVIMMIFAIPVAEFVNKHPSIQMLGLAFLILIGFMLVTEGAHLAHLQIFDQEIGAIPKGYLYFAIAFSLGVEFLNLRHRQNKPVQLHGAGKEAIETGVLPDSVTPDNT